MNAGDPHLFSGDLFKYDLARHLLRWRNGSSWYFEWYSGSGSGGAFGNSYTYWHVADVVADGWGHDSSRDTAAPHVCSGETTKSESRCGGADWNGGPRRDDGFPNHKRCGC